MSKQRIAQVAFLSVVGLVVFFVIYTILKRPESTSPPLVITLQPRPTTEPPTPTPAAINVYIAGAVNKPDVYALPVNSIVKDAITSAGGATADADLDRINLATHLADQMEVYVPHKGETAPPAPSNGSAPNATGEKININTASAEELDKLPGIGPSLAKAIVDYRTKNGPFKTIDGIKEVPRIGDSLFEKIKDQITVGP
ncbi:MAG TPA: helix-hairpin-helix domain-containing protein [Anaerolineae bacterium]|nr:helix-hairpin-helix domain-containing protein [Anaerolineae bacterium]